MKHTPDETKHETRDTMRWHLPRTTGMEHFATVELVLTHEPTLDSTVFHLELIANKAVTLVSVVYAFHQPRRH